jgi:UDP-N-acetylglucosamine 2-epimerase (non-hydrolysing)
MNRSHFVLTDSGGIQEEAPSLGKPVLAMRDTTERPEGIEAGTGRLLHDPDTYARMTSAANPYGDGHAAERIVEAIESRASLLNTGNPETRNAIGPRVERASTAR